MNPDDPSKPLNRQCTAHRKNGDRCKRRPIRGGSVCHTHGGAAPQVKKKARERLDALVEPALDTLKHLVDHAESESVAAGAANSLLDRVGYGKGSIRRRSA